MIYNYDTCFDLTLKFERKKKTTRIQSSRQKASEKQTITVFFFIFLCFSIC